MITKSSYVDTDQIHPTYEFHSLRFRPVIRLFISSTFSDMKHERNVLHEHVFPELEKFCLQNGFQFQAIDLRWGVSSEAGLDHRTMRICFTELKRAQEISPQPNFLILLGNRYGWRPLPENISFDEYHALERAAIDVEKTIHKPALSVLREWYRIDENALPSTYFLQSRRQNLHEGMDYTEDESWNKVQSILWEIINCAFPPEQLMGRFAETSPVKNSPPPIVRFQASATEQEIWHGALLVPDSKVHVLAFFREIENVDDFSYPILIKDFVDMDLPGRIDAALPDEIKRLKIELGKRLDDANVFGTKSARLVSRNDCHGRLTADVTTDHLAQFVRDVKRRLTQIIQEQIEQYWNKSDHASPERALHELKIEKDEHKRFSHKFGAEDSFVGRQSELRKILNYLQGDSPWPLVVHGASGCGKTALMARASQEAAKTRQSIIRFIGITPRSSDIRSLLSSLCQELRLLHPREGKLSADNKSLIEELHEHLRAATLDHPLILFLDALDQLSDAESGRLLHWIPIGPLPSHVKLVVSSLSERSGSDPAGQPYTELERRQIPAENFINLNALSLEESEALFFNTWLSQAKRTVSQHQRTCIVKRLATDACRHPIYLKLLFEEVRRWRSDDSVQELPETVPGLLKAFFDRLGNSANHGETLRFVLGYLASARFGLTEMEILEILHRDPQYKTFLDQQTAKTGHKLPDNPQRIPIAIWSRLHFDLEPYLTEETAPGGTVINFYHRQVAEFVKEHIVNVTDVWHERLAEYFETRWREPYTRATVELPYQQTMSELWENLEETLSDLEFLETKIQAGLPYDLLRDIDREGVIQALPRLILVRRSLATVLQSVRERPFHALTMLFNQLCWVIPKDKPGPILDSIEKTLCRLNTKSWLRAQAPLPGTERQRPHEYKMRSCFIQALDIASKRLVTVNNKSEVIVRNITTGEEMMRYKLNIQGRITTIALSNETTRIALITKDRHVFYGETEASWRARANEPFIECFPGPEVVGVREDGCLVAWNPQNGSINVLLRNLPLPLVVFRKNHLGSALLFVAGYRKQLCGIVSKGDTGWKIILLPEIAVPVTAGDMDADFESVALALTDARVVVINLKRLEMVRTLKYSNLPGGPTRGMVKGVAFGVGPSIGTIYIATERGQVWNWAPETDRTTSFGSYKTHREAGSLQCIGVWFESGLPLITTENCAQTLTSEGNTGDHDDVSAISIMNSGLVAAARFHANSISFYKPPDFQDAVQITHIHNPVTMWPQDDSDSIWITTNTGEYSKLTPPHYKYRIEDSYMMQAPVIGVFNASESGMSHWVAESNGDIFCSPEVSSDKTDLKRSRKLTKQLWTGTNYLHRIKVLPASKESSFWCMTSYEGRDNKITVERIDAPQTSCVLFEEKGWRDMATYPDRELIAVIGPSCIVYVCNSGEWNIAFSREEKGNMVVFCCEGKWLVTAAGHWLQLHRMAPNLPVEDAQEMGSTITCLASRGNRVAVGLQSGGVSQFSIPSNQ